MSQETRVLQLGPEPAEALRRRLDGERFAPRAVPHARFSFEGEGLVVTYYNSGKLVIQGADPDLFLERHLSADAAAARASVDDERIGSDEAGKGDYFGPLVVAAVYAPSGEIARLRKIGVADSKQLSDETVARIAGALEVSTAHAVVVLDPADYNLRHRAVGNVNKMLGDLHAEAILAVAKKTGCLRVLTDQFGDISHVRRGLGAESKRFDLEVRPRAEEHVAVAAASILARHAFVQGIRRLSDECGLDLPKGAGDPVERILRKVVSVVGLEGLPRLAKVHFKTTEKILGKLFG